MFELNKVRLPERLCAAVTEDGEYLSERLGRPVPIGDIACAALLVFVAMDTSDQMRTLAAGQIHETSGPLACALLPVAPTGKAVSSC